MDCCRRSFQMSINALKFHSISVLVLRYVPPDEVPLPSSLQESIDPVSLHYSQSSQSINGKKLDVNAGTSKGSDQPLLCKKVAAVGHPIIKQVQAIFSEENRRMIAGWTIMFTCLGVLLLTYAASDLTLLRPLRFTICGVGGALILCGLIVLSSIDQDDGRHSFGHAGGFLCPFVPLLPIAFILINCYLLINLGAATWARVSVWLVMGVFVYVFYGRTHSSLLDVVYVPVAHVDEIYRRDTHPQSL